MVLWLNEGVIEKCVDGVGVKRDVEELCEELLSCEER
jgi:hypothetical protein